MKKYLLKGLGISVGASIALSSVSAFAAPSYTDEDFKAALSKNYTSAEFTANVVMNIDEISNELMDALQIDDENLSTYINMDCAYNSSEDFKKLQMKMNMNIPGTAPSVMSEICYIDMDLTNEDAPVYRTITKLPDEDKYIVTDMSSLTGTMQTLLDTSTINQLQGLSKKLNSEFTDKKAEIKDGVYTAVYTENEVKAILSTYLTEGADMFIPMLNSIKKAVNTNSELTPDITDGSVIGGAKGNSDINVLSSSDITDSMRKEYQEDLKKLFDALDDIKLFADDAITLNAELNDNKDIKTMGLNIKLDINLYDAVTKLAPIFGASQSDLAEFEEIATKENSNIKLSMSADYVFTALNNVAVEFPTLTPENTITIDYANPNAIQLTQPIQKDGVQLIPLREFCNKIGITDDNISYDSGVVTVKCDFPSAQQFIVTISSSDITITDANGAISTFELDNPAIIINDRTYVTLNFAEIFNLKWIEDNKFEYCIE